MKMKKITLFICCRFYMYQLSLNDRLNTQVEFEDNILHNVEYTF